jgi:hypothetical protein
MSKPGATVERRIWGLCSLSPKLFDIGGVAGDLHDGKGVFDGFGKNVKKCAGPNGPEDYASAILVGFHTEVDAGVFQELLQTEGVLQTLGNINEDRGFTFEKPGILLHCPIVNLLA